MRVVRFSHRLIHFRVCILVFFVVILFLFLAVVFFFFFFFFKKKPDSEFSACLLGSEMLIRDRYYGIGVQFKILVKIKK